MKTLLAFIALVGLSLPTYAQVPLPPRPLPPLNTSENVTQQSPAPARLSVQPDASSTESPTFSTKQVVLRQPRNGYHLGVYGGFNFFQDHFGNAVIKNAGAPDTELERRTRMGGIGGVRLGYDWPFKNEPIELFDNELGGSKIKISGGIEGEVLGAYIPYKGQDPTGLIATADFYTLAFMLNGYVKAQVGKFRPYAGPGIGLACIWGRDYKVAGNQQGDEAFEMAFQVNAGTDYFLNEAWSLFLDYKFFVLPDLQIFDSPRTFNAETFSADFINAGIRYHF